MPDWQHEIRARLAPLQVPPDRERSIVEEVSQTRRRPRRLTMGPPAPDTNKRREGRVLTKTAGKDDTGASGACDGPPALKTVS